MAMQTYVFFKREKMPTTEELQKEIRNSGFDLIIPEQLDLKFKSPVCVHAEFEGLESEFDYVHDDYDPDEWSWEPSDMDVLGNPDAISVWNTYSNAQEIVGMLITAAAMSKLTGGPIYSDFFSEDLVGSEEVVAFVSDIVEGAREQFSGPSKVRKANRNAIDA